jgi:hypothetical protein
MPHAPAELIIEPSTPAWRRRCSGIAAERQHRAAAALNMTNDQL